MRTMAAIVSGCRCRSVGGGYGRWGLGHGRVGARSTVGKQGAWRAKGERMGTTAERGVLSPALVRIRDVAGAVVGAGFLVDGDLVCTCAHVVARALGLARVPSEFPTG